MKLNKAEDGQVKTGKKGDVAIMGATYHQLPLIERAKELGYTTHVFAWAAGDIGETAADHFYPISTMERDAILEKCREIGVDGVCSIATDVGLITANYVADKMGLVGNSMESTWKSTNKHLMRKAFEENGDPSPRSTGVDADTDLSTIDFTYPLIVKPTDRSGSRGVRKIESPDELEDAVRAALEQSFEHRAVVEEFAEGQEYSVEFISYKGKHTFLALTFKYTTGAPYFIESGHFQPAPVSDELRDRIAAVVAHALDSLGIEYGATCSEVKVDDEGNIKLIEICPRMGGDCIGSDLVKYSTGLDYVGMVVQIACGEEPDFTPIVEPFPVESVFIFNQEDLDRFRWIQEHEPDRIVRIVDMDLDLLGTATDSSNRAGCYVMKHRD